MVKMSYDVVKRWVNEAQEAASSDNIMVQVDSTLHRKMSARPHHQNANFPAFYLSVPRFGPVVSP